MEKKETESTFISLLKKQSFQPSFFSIFFHPFYFIRRDLCRNIRHHSNYLSGNLLDFGCGRKPYKDLFSVNSYTGVDLEKTGHDHRLSLVDVYYDGKTLPFENDRFDSLFCSEVLEHVFNPNEILKEMSRVLKNGAPALITTPFCWNEHEVPFDYARYSIFGMKHLLEKNGFRVKKIVKSGHFSRVYFQLGALYFYEVFKKYGIAGKLLAQFFITPINLIGSLISFILPRNKSLYFNNIIIAEKC
jgi:SAM-dependent methyltransferase